MSEPTRPIPLPTVEPDGSLVAHTVATPKAFKIRARMLVPSRKVIPVILVPGIMGTNLRVRRDASLPQDGPARPGEPAWRAPNGGLEEVLALRKWLNRDARQRQLILNPNAVEVDDRGEIASPDSSLRRADLHRQGWGEVHADSYGRLLGELQMHLNETFVTGDNGKRHLRAHWQRVIECDPARWGVRNLAPLTEDELTKHASYHYPVYAVGYNWLESCAKGAARLEQRIGEIIAYWQGRKHECSQVILVTHSMGGLVARACAKRLPDKVAGVVHGVMPALGAPVAYRRMVRGTETTSNGGFLDDMFSQGLATVIGSTTEQTTAVMATAPGALELLPNHLYPRPWLHLRTVSTLNRNKQYHDWVNLPAEASPYPMYRDTQSWYRLVDPALADPAGLHAKAGVEATIGRAIDEAEQFHVQALGDYFHPNTYAYYGADPDQPAYGRISWIADDKAAAGRVALSASAVSAGKFERRCDTGKRDVNIAGCSLSFDIAAQDAAGDGTVPEKSGACPGSQVKQVFATRGFDHQESYKSNDVLLLTQYLIAKIVQDAR